VLVQPEIDRRRSPLVSIPPRRRGFVILLDLPAANLDSTALSFRVLLIDFADSEFPMSAGNKKPGSLFAQRGVTEELNITGTQLLIALAVATSLAVPLIWWFVQYAYSAP